MCKLFPKTIAVVTFVWLLMVAASSFAQTTNASLGGTVSDGTGALIPGVAVSARNIGTGIVNESITNEAGAYQFPNLQTGSYEVTAELTGFRTQRFANVALGVAQQVRLNFRLEVGDLSTTVDVTTGADTTLATTSASIGTVLPDLAVRELPLGDRNVLELLSGMGGTGPTEGNLDGNFAGGRLSATNVTRDGLVVSAGRYNQGVLGVTYMSPDLVEEVRVTTGTVDAESGRGSGQVQMVTRSGTNELRGSAFWYNRNSALSASNWFNNFNGAAKDWSNRNQFGVRLGGPIVQNKTFFFFLIDEQRDVTKENFVGTVLTPQARQGLYRFFPGANNENAQQNNPAVDRNGNPVRPANATGDLQSINLFSFDPARRGGYDPSGWMQQVLLARMPMPNDYTVGDGLNTAGIRFTRRIYGFDNNTQELVDRNNRDQFNLRLDHNFNPSNKLSFIYTWEHSVNNATTAGIQQWPNGYDGENSKFPRLYSLSFVSTFSNVVNEFRAGYRLHHVGQWAPFYKGIYRGEGPLTDNAKEAFALLPKSNGFQYQPIMNYYAESFMNFNASWASTRGSYSPLLTIADTLSWQHGSHSFKVGFEGRRDRTMGWNDTNMTPIVTIGAGNFPAPIETNTVSGLTSSNATVARNILYNLSGSIDNVRQGFDLVSTSDTQFRGIQDGVMKKIRDWRLGEITTFFKDEWKVTSNLTLNLGLQWEWYGAHYEQRGIAGKVVGGYDGLCGIGCTGQLTRLEFAGKNSPNPDNLLHDNDFNNFAPNVGFSYSIPGLGRSTILRGGYGVHYAGKEYLGPSWIDVGAGTLPGLAGGFGCCGLTYSPGTQYWNLANLQLPFAPSLKPLESVSLTEPRTLTMNMYEQDRPTPYTQNLNVSIQRELADDLLLDISYVGTKATKLYGYTDLNYQKIFETQFLDAFNVTRAGGNHPLFDRMLMGLPIPGAGTVNGTTLTGSAALRLYSQTRTLLANGAAGGVADFLNRSTNVTGAAGGFIRNGGLPEDFLVFNPQFQVVTLQGNPGNSNYHALQVNLTKRFSRGFSNQTSYTWSKVLGVGDTEETVSSRDPRNRNLDRAALSFHRSQVFTSNGTLSLPFGPQRRFLSSGPSWVQRLVEQWGMSGILRISTGAPLTLAIGNGTNGVSNIHAGANNTPDILGQMPEGKVTKNTDGSLPTYFPGLRQGTAGSDPGGANVTTANTLQSAYTNRVIYGPDGSPLLVNPEPGKVGTLGVRTVTGPSRIQFDANLVKRVQINETKTFEFRADVTNVFNHPVFNNPTAQNLDINNAQFGRITSAADGRKVVLGARLNF